MEALPRESQRGLEIVSRSAGRSLLIIGFPGRSLETNGDKALARIIHATHYGHRNTFA
ncbi:hypothetical protein Pla52n_52820 [Stieleria varia]|uniref:Uncharacterized protein n=1 Tax=Stieleria varia TaxID=2528005 RepID=A0A5C6A5W9_9BACT|nr:hypothetical protein Pla52n_52820 [Stieleria varia]